MQEHSNPCPNSSDISIDLCGYLKAVGIRKVFVLKVTLASFLLSIGVAVLLPNIYSSTTRILPPAQDQTMTSLMLGQLGGGALSSIAGNILGTGTPSDQYAAILESERVRDPIIDRFKLMEEYKQNYRLDMYSKMDKIVSVDAGKKDGIITITVEDEDPKKAADIANAYVEELGKLTAEMSISDAGKNHGFVEGRLLVARADLARAEEALKTFQTRTKAVSVPDQVKATIEGIAMLKAQIAVQEAQLSALRSQFTESTQEVQAVRAGIRNLQSKVAGLEGAGTGAIPSIGSVPGLGQDQVRLLREFKMQETIVELLTKQNELSKMSEAKNINTVQVIQKAKAPDKKIKPKRSLIVLAATFFVFCNSVLWVLVSHYLENLGEASLARWKTVKAAYGWKRNQ